MVKKGLSAPSRTVFQGTGNYARLVVEKEFAREIGKSGERVLRIVVAQSGRIVTAFPAKEFIAGLAAAAVLPAIEGNAIAAIEEIERGLENYGPSGGPIGDAIDWLLGMDDVNPLDASKYIQATAERFATEAVKAVEESLNRSLEPEEREEVISTFDSVVRGSAEVDEVDELDEDK